MDENQKAKEIYAHFGRAVYPARVLEHGLVAELSVPLNRRLLAVLFEPNGHGWATARERRR